jgi:hypothetical protein
MKAMKDKISESHDEVVRRRLRENPKFAAEYLKAALEDTGELRRSSQNSLSVPPAACSPKPELRHAHPIREDHEDASCAPARPAFRWQFA